jgi:hypothetical protein
MGDKNRAHNHESDVNFHRQDSGLLLLSEI